MVGDEDQLPPIKAGTSLNVLLSAITVAAIIAGLQTVGVILMSAMLVALL